METAPTTQMLNRLAERYDMAVHETPVGFNHIFDLMLGEPVLVGGEESGGIGIFGYIPEGDGLLMGLQLVARPSQRHLAGAADLCGGAQRGAGARALLPESGTLAEAQIGVLAAARLI